MPYGATGKPLSPHGISRIQGGEEEVSKKKDPEIDPNAEAWHRPLGRLCRRLTTVYC
jgi:hypothetical protein